MNPLPVRDPRLLHLTHVTEYSYAEPVSLSFHLAILTPRPTPWQDVSRTRITIDPPAQHSESRTDYYRNAVTHFTLATPHRHLRVEAGSVVRLRQGTALPFPESAPLDEIRDRVRRAATPDDLAAYEFMFDSPHVARSEELAGYAGPSFPEGRPFLDGVQDLMQRVHQDFRYDATVTTVSTPVAEVLAGRHGVCQDFAHLMIGCLRSIGVAARYVSGYLVPGADVVGAQASHAWIAVYCPGPGWFDFDPTNNVRPAGGHVTAAWGRDYSDVSPFRGIMVGGGEHTVTVEVRVEPGGEGDAPI